VGAHRVFGILTMATLLAVVGPLPAGASGPVTKLASKTSSGVPANGDSFAPAVSASGRYVAFESDADNLPGDDAVNNVYVHDRQTGNTRLASKATSGEPADGTSTYTSISANGRYVAFGSLADNLPGNDGNYDIFVHDRQTGRTRLASKTSEGVPAEGTAFGTDLSGNGRYVIFASNADNLPGEDAFNNVYVHDRQTGNTRLASKTSEGVPADGNSVAPSISADGRYAAFHSDADNLPGDDTVTDVFVHNRETGRTLLVSVTSGGTPSDGSSFAPSLSSTGRYVAFYSNAQNFPGNDAVADVFLHDRRSGRTKLVSQTTGGTPANGNSTGVDIAAGGGYVGFHSNADNLPGRNAFVNVYLRGPLT
jgi:Tol biopolymer transport system component